MPGHAACQQPRCASAGDGTGTDSTEQGVLMFEESHTMGHAEAAVQVNLTLPAALKHNVVRKYKCHLNR